MFYYDINIPSSHGYICQKRFFNETYTSRLHWHGFIELELFLEVKGVHNCSSQSLPLQKGDIWLLSTSDSHQVTVEKGTRSVNLALDPDILDKKLLEQLTVTHPLHCTLDEDESRAFMEKVDILCYEQENREMYAKIKAIAVINEMIVDIIRKSLPDSAPISNPIINNIVNYLQSNYQNNISLTELAQMFSLTPNYCGYLFKKNMGITYNDYLNTLRLKNACKLLSNSKISVKEVASTCGFNSLEYFYTTFKKFYGITPAKYRSLTPTQIAKTKIHKMDGV